MLTCIGVAIIFFGLVLSFLLGIASCVRSSQISREVDDAIPAYREGRVL